MTGEDSSRTAFSEWRVSESLRVGLEGEVSLRADVPTCVLAHCHHSETKVASANDQEDISLGPASA